MRAELKVRAGLRPPPLPKTAVRGRPASAAAQPSSSVTSAAVPRFIVMPYRASIAAMMRQVFSDPELARLGDRELARRYGLSPTTIGNWRRRLRK